MNATQNTTAAPTAAPTAADLAAIAEQASLALAAADAAQASAGGDMLDADRLALRDDATSADLLAADNARDAHRIALAAYHAAHAAENKARTEATRARLIAASWHALPTATPNTAAPAAGPLANLDDMSPITAYLYAETVVRFATTRNWMTAASDAVSAFIRESGGDPDESPSLYTRLFMPVLRLQHR